jgi:hypothetical protein
MNFQFRKLLRDSRMFGMCVFLCVCRLSTLNNLILVYVGEKSLITVL